MAEMRAWEPFLKVEGWGSGFVGVDRALKHYMGETRSEHTRQNFCDALMRFLRFAGLDPDEAVGLGRDEASELVQGYVDHLAGRGLSIRGVNTALAFLTVFFRVNGFAGEKELEVERHKQPTRYRKRLDYIPTPEEIYKMAFSSGSKRNRAIVLALYTSGLRNSTLRAVRIGDVLDELEQGLDAVRLPVYPEMKALVADACKGRISYYSFISHEAVDAHSEITWMRGERDMEACRRRSRFSAPTAPATTPSSAE